MKKNDLKSAPTKAETASLPPFPGLSLEHIVVPDGEVQFSKAFDEIYAAGLVGFDTESKPTFRAGEKSKGPHVFQFSTESKAYIFQLHRKGCLEFALKILNSDQIKKVGFGLKSDRHLIQQRFGIRLQNTIDVDSIFKPTGYRKVVGARAAIAILFEQLFHKSKKQSMSNWAAKELKDNQLIYAANDAYVALRVYKAITH